jgi:hypothetical protein
VPQDWHSHRLPQFFNCGGRSQVLSVYAQLRERSDAAPDAGYLTADKLYALVDLDLQQAGMPAGYPWQTSEDVHTALYQDGTVHGVPDDSHRIWVTALIHKEAFFVLPPMAAAWEDGAIPFFCDAPLNLKGLHEAIADRLTTDTDFAGNLEVVAARLARFKAGAALTCMDGESLRTAWRAAAMQADANQYEGLLRALLSVAQVKPVWSQITPDPRYGATMPAENFRDQLALKVAATIAKAEPEQHPLASFFAWLKPRR